MSSLPGAYTQLIGLGLVWVSVHCVGMCGPLLVGLDVAGTRKGHSVGRGMLAVLLYQAGRALTYAWLGALCGLLGAGLLRVLQPLGSILAISLGGVAIVAALRSLPLFRRAADAAMPSLIPVGRLVPNQSAGRRQPMDRLLALVRGLLPQLLHSAHPLQPMAVGALMGLLPCMLVGWTLGLAALTASPLHGAGVMLLLVAMTTPMLLLATALPSFSSRIRGPLRSALARTAAFLPGMAGLWLVLAGAAGLGLIDHQHLGFSVLGRAFLVMVY